nr:reverse transcriptase domain-containing protein [Tanacetum cinerariifolium]
MCPHIQEARSGIHTTVVAGTQKAATKVLALKKQKLLPRNIATKESIREERKQCQKVQEGTRSQNQRSKSRVWRKTYPNHGVLFDDLPKESIDSYDDLRKAFLENYLQQKKCIKDPVEIHNIKQRDGESTEEFVRRYKLECRDVKGASECMKIFGFMHEITNPKLIKRLHDKIPKLIDEMMSVTTTFLRGEVAASNRERKKSFPSWKQEAGQKRNAKGQKALTFDQGIKAKPRKRPGKDSKKGETSGKDKPLAILMVPPWQRIARQRITQTFSSESVISFPTLGEEDGTEGPMIIETEIGGCCVHRIYIDGGSSSKILYEHCFSKFRPEIKTQLIPTNTPLVGFSGEIIWPLGQISLLVKIGDEEHSTSAWMNFIVVRSPSPYNGIIERPGVRKIRAIPSTAHEMIKTLVAGGIVTLQSSRIIPLECSMVSEPGVPRGQAPERNKAISEEVKKLVEADIMKEVHYHSWLSNPVMVKKHDDNWRMCVDFKDLNKACPKDGYPLPKIDWKVESICGYPYKCFLDAYKGYHQIKMAEEDEEKTAFITSQGIIYDLVIKSRTKKEVIKDIEEMFKTLREINMKLNPKKCAFGIREGIFLGYKVDADGLRVCPDKVKAVLDLPSPKCLKDVQKLNGKLASLNRFLSKSAEKSLPFFKTLKKCTKKSDFQWTPKAEGAFKEMKQSIAELPMLTAPREKEELIVYLAAAKEAISAVLMTEMDGKQVPIYFVSRALQGPKINYTPMEKLILALYRPRTSVRGQILADFIVEHPEDDTPDTPMEDREELPYPWIFFTDESSCIDGFGAGLIITNPEGMEFTYALRFKFNATNNEAEYEALIAGLWIAGQMGVQNLQANVDSKLVANQRSKLMPKASLFLTMSTSAVLKVSMPISAGITASTP